MYEYEMKEIETKKTLLISISSLISGFLIAFLHSLIKDTYLTNFVFPCMILLCNYGFLLWKLDYKTRKNGFLLLLPILLILLSNFIVPVDGSNLFLNVLILPFCISIFFFSLINPHYHISRHSFSFLFKLFPSGLFRNFTYLKKLPKKEKKSTKGKGILVGLCLGLPISYVLILLLGQADPYFHSFMLTIQSYFSFFLQFDFLKNYIFVLFIFSFLFFVIFINLVKHEDTTMKENKYRNIKEETILTVLIIINAVFVLFLLSEISKVTTNFLKLPAAYTYARYAREGFFQLLFVTVINFSIISYKLYFTEDSKNKWIQRLLLLLIVFSIALICNSYYRMFLYIGSYGFTVLRLQVILFLFMELILFLLFIRKMYKGLGYKDAVLFISIILTTYIINLYLFSAPFATFLNAFVL
ncbi:MAG: DUF4173 domain-containing protein [Bacilli bacterium]|nr:DUF4173 domain-containing protein [Bacilli bacterium]